MSIVKCIPLTKYKILVLSSRLPLNGYLIWSKYSRKCQINSYFRWILSNVLSLLLHLIVIHDESQFKKRYLEEEMMIKTEGYLSCSGNSNNNMDQFFVPFFNLLQNLRAIFSTIFVRGFLYYSSIQTSNNSKVLLTS